MTPGQCGGRVLVTGATGFVGRALVQRLLREGYPVVAASRTGELPGGATGAIPVAIGDVDGGTDWSAALAEVTTVFHLVARTHETGPHGVAAEHDYHRINVDGTRRLAEQAAAAGTAHLIYLSSVKVHGERTHGRPFTEDDPLRPEGAYGRTKRAAEDVLWHTLSGSATAATVVRPPLIYGPGVQANMLALVRVVQRGWPLPFASVDNRRSLIALDNLTDLLVTCVRRPEARGGTFLASDAHDLSTPQLVEEIAAALGRPARLLPCSPGLLAASLQAVGKARTADKLLGSLEVDTARVEATLGWRPPVAVSQALFDMVRSRQATRPGT